MMGIGDHLNNPVKCCTALLPLLRSYKTCRAPFGGDYTHYTQDGLNTIRQ